jgi:hypothetical protein
MIDTQDGDASQGTASDDEEAEETVKRMWAFRPDQ